MDFMLHFGVNSFLYIATKNFKFIYWLRYFWYFGNCAFMGLAFRLDCLYKRQPCLVVNVNGLYGFSCHSGRPVAKWVV